MPQLWKNDTKLDRFLKAQGHEVNRRKTFKSKGFRSENRHH